jgi:hypothetical protein
MLTRLRSRESCANFCSSWARSSSPLFRAQTPLTGDDIIARYIKTVGGADKIKMTGINAYDGSNGWKIYPFGGKKDAEALREDELRGIAEDSDFDEPLIDYGAKGNKVELVGMDQVEGTDVYRLKVTLKSGDTRYYYMETDSYASAAFGAAHTLAGRRGQFALPNCAAKVPAGDQLAQRRPSQMQLDRADAIRHELSDVVAAFDAWSAKDLAALNTELGTKNLQPIVLITRQDWAAVGKGGQ